MHGSHTKAGVLAFVASIDPGTRLEAWKRNTPTEIKKGILKTDSQLNLLKALSYILREWKRKTKNKRNGFSFYVIFKKFIIYLGFYCEIEFARCYSPSCLRSAAQSLFCYLIFLWRATFCRKLIGHHAVLLHLNQCSLHPSSWVSTM